MSRAGRDSEGSWPASGAGSRGIRVLWRASVPVVTLALAGVFLIEAADIQGRDAIYPVAALAVLAVVGLIALIREIRAALSETAVAGGSDGIEDAAGAEDIESERGIGVAWSRVGPVVAAVVLALVILHFVGYVIAIVWLCAVTAVTLGLRKPLWIAVFTAATAATCYLVFAVAFESPIPAGTLLNW
ncbi:tripartite tricarboxylate transporter TctB family protein [Qaidamihabitans albus]|uniref:tripartite tricarboxylate transporter TctB family protein n=1 Tax=Qaidamihabitans albus TaxID=2795733 RepID=UPI0018F16B2E|nr:tripartite tricarboxylate transporter TctB family protein [Qaidamihabitans albus]